MSKFPLKFVSAKRWQVRSHRRTLCGHSASETIRFLGLLGWVDGSRDIVQQWMGVTGPSTPFLAPPDGAVTRYIKFVWVVKRSSAVSWFASQLDQIVRDVEALRNQGQDIAVDINIYVTGEDGLSTSRSSTNGHGFEAPGTLSEKDIALDTIFPSKLNDSSLLGSRIVILLGRPKVTNIIRRMAEAALGEMAAVVCGPPGLVQSTRNAAAMISDERAVHKGTGAQGIYVHAEAFEYAWEKCGWEGGCGFAIRSHSIFMIN